MDDRENPINGRNGRLEAVRWPFERLAWATRRGVVWPLQDRFSQLGGPERAVALVASAVIAVCLVAIGVGLAGSGNSPGDPAPPQAATTEPLVLAAPLKTEKQPEPPTLEGAAPVLKPESAGPKRTEKKSAAEQTPAAPGTEPASTGSAATDTISSSPAAASSSAAEGKAEDEEDEAGRPAGAEALAVAEEFADAFVVYETGGTDAKVRKAFGSSATRELTRSLLRRPPRLPANAKVPKAKVLNVVAAPSHDGIYPVSVSLLRIGVTSELRLELEVRKGKRWRVTNVLG